MEPASYYIPKEECLLDKVLVKRGEIYMADLDPVVGSEQGSIRPVLIIQNDKGNQYSPTTVVLPLTTKVHKSMGILKQPDVYFRQVYRRWMRHRLFRRNTLSITEASIL